MANIFESVLDIFFSKAREERVMARVAEEQRQRLAEMAKDPVRRKYVERIEHGEYWQDEDMLFNEDVNATNVCEHLYPIEQLMRQQKIDLRKLQPLRIQADCLVDHERFDRELNPPECVQYREFHIPDRSMLDPWSGMINCSTCESYINVDHRDTAKSGTPVFPR